MHIVIMGTGGMGGYYGGLLSRAGNDVTFIARGAHLAAIQQNGLQVRSVHGDFVVSPAHATDDVAGVPSPDLILFCVKTYHTDEAAAAVRPIVGPHTTVLSLQNGIDAPERIGRVVGMEHMIAGATWISSAVEAPGVIHQFSQFRRIVIGELNARRTPRVEAAYETLKQAGIEAELSDDILKIMWTKFVFIAAASSFGSLTRLPIGEYRSVPETRFVIMALLREVEAVARRQGIRLDADVVDKTMTFIDNNGPKIKPSMQVDVEAGRRTEIESIIGVVGRRGRELGVSTPVADVLYASLLPVDLKARAAAEAA
ncbi:MAG TPA: ketopantoate reductase family protein [Anaerolineales bacterium]|nr:ketopantoate reductase family protein [Anaerolineales bacterium]